MIASAFLHWLLSNAIYIFVSQGPYFQELRNQRQIYLSYSDPNLPEGSTVSVGYSVIALVILACGLLAGFTLPLIWSRKRLPGVGNSVGCNSFAISAPCHVSPLSIPAPESHGSPKRRSRIDLGNDEALDDNETEMALILPAEGHSTHRDGEVRLEKIAQSRLKWGVVEMPPDWSSQYSEAHEQVGHISFGTNEDQVEEPAHDHWYA